LTAAVDEAPGLLPDFEHAADWRSAMRADNG